MLYDRKRGRAIQCLLNATAYVKKTTIPFTPERKAIKVLLRCAVALIAEHTYVGYGLRIDRDPQTGALNLFPESDYYARENGDLIRFAS